MKEAVTSGKRGIRVLLAFRTITDRTNCRDGLLFLACYGVLWLILTGGKGWLFGTAFAFLATVLSMRLGVTLQTFRPLRLPGLLFFYLRELLAAGWQVAWNACRPRMKLQPGWVVMDLKTRSDRTQMLLATFVCLLPGTLTSRVHQGKMHIHLLNQKQPWRPTVEKLEARLMAMLEEKSG